MNINGVWSALDLDYWPDGNTEQNWPPTHLNWGQFTDNFCHTKNAIYDRVLVVAKHIECIYMV